MIKGQPQCIFYLYRVYYHVEEQLLKYMNLKRPGGVLVDGRGVCTWVGAAVLSSRRATWRSLNPLLDTTNRSLPPPLPLKPGLIRKHLDSPLKGHYRSGRRSMAYTLRALFGQTKPNSPPHPHPVVSTQGS